MCCELSISRALGGCGKRKGLVDHGLILRASISARSSRADWLEVALNSTLRGRSVDLVMVSACASRRRC